ncbi:hypothetical protein EMIT0194P_130060 [Pseudomonas serbica]
MINSADSRGQSFIANLQEWKKCGGGSLGYSSVTRRCVLEYPAQSPKCMRFRQANH